jgi:hypothetical protein|tara:strand:+ start:5525 stop:6271 length:747 start_codon:yes stop_codon:yes gene_type:complete
MKSDLPLFYYQPNQVDYLQNSLTLNGKIFKDIAVLMDSKFEIFDSFYKHMSYNAEYFERFCFYRYFSALKYAKQNNIDKFLMCDTDAIFLKSLDFEKILGDDKCVACKPQDQNKNDDIVCIHNSIWTRDGIEDFCNFLIETYSNNIEILMPKWEWHVSTQTGGGICDMTLMYHWYGSDKNLYNLQDGVFDRGIGMSKNNIEDEFKMKNEIKQLKKIDNKIFGINYKDEEVEFYGLHFQGHTKKYMNLL